MSKLILLAFSLTFCCLSNSQNEKFNQEELKTIEDLKTGSNVWMDHDLVKDEIEFRSSVCTKLPLIATDFGIILKMRCVVVKVNDVVCLKSLTLKQQVTRSGVGLNYDKIVFIVGNSSDIKNGEAKKYSFSVQPDFEGLSFVNDFEIFEMFKYSIDNYKAVEMHVINSVNEMDLTYDISISKVKSNFGGLIETFENLNKGFSKCDENSNSQNNEVSLGEKIEGDFVLTKDEFYERTFYKHVSVNSIKQIVLNTTSGSVAFYLYFSIPFDSSKAEGLRLYVMYHGEDWIFFERIIVLIDSIPVEVSCDPETETLTGNGILEFTDISVTENSQLHEALNKMNNESVIKVRLVGKYKHDYTLEAGVRAAFISTFNKYKELGGI